MLMKVVATTGLLITRLSYAVDLPIPASGNEACLQGPMAQFGRYIGDWKIADQAMAKDGSGWAAGDGARWVFACVGDGTAVQDYWLPNKGGFGTNIRTYNADTESWEIVWAASTQKGLMHISAKQNDAGDVVMDVLSPEPTPPRRITFFPPDENGWNWVMEMSYDDRKSWTPVYRITATRWES